MEGLDGGGVGARKFGLNVHAAERWPGCVSSKSSSSSLSILS